VELARVVRRVVMVGYIEMAGLKMLRDLLEGSGWCEALAQANVAVDGSAHVGRAGELIKSQLQRSTFFRGGHT